MSLSLFRLECNSTSVTILGIDFSNTESAAQCHDDYFGVVMNTHTHRALKPHYNNICNVQSSQTHFVSLPVLTSCVFSASINLR